MLASVKSSNRTPVYRRQLGLAIRSRREQLAVSQEKLAEYADVHRNYIGLVERGEQNLTVDSLCKLAAALRCRASDLLRRVGS